MIKYFGFILLFIAPILGATSLAKDGRPESSEVSRETVSDAEHKDPEKDEHGHEEAEHEHEEEGGSAVGPEKGITEASEQDGIKLSPEAIRNFEIKTQKLSGSSPWTLPSSARLLALEESNLYRVRNGYFKRIDFNLLKGNQSQITIKSNELMVGDEIVTNGVGFLRIAELTAFGGAPEGHSH